jgi:peptidoglycan/xylan/chitin deacetylase (PgdA/CDA1 family)
MRPLPHERFYAVGPVVVQIGAATSIHLTFDDGPHAVITPAILDVLAAHGARATFFQEGRHVEALPELTQRAVREGHAVGNHSWDHPDFGAAETTLDEVRRQLESTSSEIDRATGSRPSLFRPPYGRLGDTMREQQIRAEVAALGMETILWTITPEDWQRPGVDPIVQCVIGEAESGAIVLMHDGGDVDGAANVAAVESIVEELGRRGFTFEPLA